jgi:hypothetical protein
MITDGVAGCKENEPFESSLTKGHRHVSPYGGLTFVRTVQVCPKLVFPYLLLDISGDNGGDDNVWIDQTHYTGVISKLIGE